MKKILVLILFFAAGICFAAEEKTGIRVGISDNSFSSWEHSAVEFILSGNSVIQDMEGGGAVNVASGGKAGVSIENGVFLIDTGGEIQNAKGPLVITSSNSIGISGLKRKGEPARYAGMIELIGVKPDKFNIVNVLDTQTYLKGVVPNEMPVSFGIEALKAQAVAARNYANRPNSPYKNYDVCDSTACQVYYGANSQTAVSDRAVDETLGIFALYNDEIILALYSSTASGVTEDYFNTFGNFEEDKPYLKSVSDCEKLEKMSDEEYFKTSPPSFDMNSPKYRWVKEFDRFELENILSKTLLAQSRAGNVSPAYGANDRIYGLESIKVLKRGKSRKALEVEIKAVSGTYVVSRELPVRRVFGGLYSANFMVEKEKAGKKEEEAPVFQDENRIYRTRLGKKLPGKFVFYGAGFGHGVGMSQYGAGFLSERGITYDKILSHYYKGSYLGTMPKTVSYNNLDLNFVQEFYFSKKKAKGISKEKSPLKDELKALSGEKQKPRCYLIIENQNGVSNAEFFINDYHFNPEIKGFRKKILKTEITEYLVEGKNKITFKPLGAQDKKKTLRFYVSLGAENE